jgi:hypothetical protein
MMRRSVGGENRLKPMTDMADDRPRPKEKDPS